jgi:hypothetical protein
MAESIFINYRRGEDQAAAGRLYDQLEAAFTRERIFIDVDNIAPGRDFTEELATRVEQCDVFLAVVGRRWADVVDVDGSRRLDNPNDWVRVEIQSAQRLGKHIIPVLVDGAEMPRPEKLPDALQPPTFVASSAATPVVPPPTSAAPPASEPQVALAPPAGASSVLTLTSRGGGASGLAVAAGLETSGFGSLKPAGTDLAALTPLVAAELGRLGCYNGAATGWDAVDLRLGVDKFAELAKLATLPAEPDVGLLAALKSEPDHFCAPQCSSREVASDGRCVPKTCGANQVLTRDGACVARQPKLQPTTAARAPTPAAGKRCFTFNGSSYCE